MGGTLPVLSRFFVRNLRTVGWDVGILYTINTLGAVAGVLLAGFYLEATYGVRMSIYIASAVNITIGLAALFLASREKSEMAATQPDCFSAAATTSPGGLKLAVWLKLA